MWTGRQALERIEGTISNLHRQENELDSALASATAEAERLRRERSDAFRELARIKLDEITAERLVDNLDAAERRAARVLEDRRRKIEALLSQRAEAIEAAEAAEAQRSMSAADLESILDDFEKFRTGVETSVRAQPEWAAARQDADAAESIATEAEKKASQSEAELAAKRKPYDDDPLFGYLWTSRFGTPSYGAWPVTRYIDRVIARFIGYADARANFAMLLEIPVRLREHANARRAKADERRAALAAIERQALIAAGVEEKERAIAAARQRLADAEARLESKRRLLRDLDAKRDALVSGSDDAAYSEALQTIAAGDAHDDFDTLVQEAKRTSTLADDSVVRRIGELNDRVQKLDAEIADLRKSARAIAERRVEVERARDRFRRSGYDHPDAVFDNDSQLGKVLAQVLEGVVRSGVLWDLLRGGFGVRRPRGRPDFGGRPLPFPFPIPGERDGTRGGEWRTPERRGGWIPPFDFPPGRGRDRGDDDRFSTGGSF